MKQIVECNVEEIQELHQLLQITAERAYSEFDIPCGSDVTLERVVFSDGAAVEMKIVVPLSHDHPYIQAQFYKADGMAADMEIRGEWLGEWRFEDHERHYLVKVALTPQT